MPTRIMMCSRMACLALALGAVPAIAAGGPATFTPAPGSDLAVESWTWGPAQPAPPAMGAAPWKPRIAQVPPLTGPSPADRPGPVNVANRFGRGESIESIYFEHSVRTAREAGSGLASGKRGEQPLDQGSLALRLVAPWPGCAPGRRFDDAALVSEGRQHYRLSGAEVVRCQGAAVTVNYSAVAIADR